MVALANQLQESLPAVFQGILWVHMESFACLVSLQALTVELAMWWLLTLFAFQWISPYHFENVDVMLIEVSYGGGSDTSVFSALKTGSL